jgi:hypothetical protein
MIKTIYKDISPYILTYSQSSFNVWFWDMGLFTS